MPSKPCLPGFYIRMRLCNFKYITYRRVSFKSLASCVASYTLSCIPGADGYLVAHHASEMPAGTASGFRPVTRHVRRRQNGEAHLEQYNVCRTDGGPGRSLEDTGSPPPLARPRIIKTAVPHSHRLQCRGFACLNEIMIDLQEQLHILHATHRLQTIHYCSSAGYCADFSSPARCAVLRASISTIV